MKVKKSKICRLFLPPAVMAFCAISSCVEKGYEWDNINKEGAFSHDNGISVLIGDFDTIRFRTQAEIPSPVSIVYFKEVEDLFSEEIYNYFVYDNKGQEESLGAISFVADFVSNINDPADKQFSDFELSTTILNDNGQDTGISIEKQIYRADVNTPQSFVVNIKTEDVVKLKDAHILLLTFEFQARKVEREDYVLIKNVKLILSGGIKISLE
ncbi:MAG: hypothetical protein LBD89_03325 [Tannerellaceae bacterium]|jgi:hypothetical protein|nr:hypothetical protein [Tannerellaceae bacterium]